MWYGCASSSLFGVVLVHYSEQQAQKPAAGQQHRRRREAAHSGVSAKFVRFPHQKAQICEKNGTVWIFIAMFPFCTYSTSAVTIN